MNLKQNEAINKTIALYSNVGWKNIFSRIRFWDAPYIETEKLVPKKGFIVDLGCGEGIFTNFLGLSSVDRRVLGIEIDKKRIKDANRGLKNVSFQWGDVTRVQFPSCDTIVIFHVLHHLNSYSEQKNLIVKCFNQLKRGGKLIIVEVEPKFSFIYCVTWLTDHFIVPWLFEKRLYSPIFFRKSSDWRRIISKNNFSCTIINAQKGHPFTHVILECQKK